MAKQPEGGGITWTNETWNFIRSLDLVTGKLGWFCIHASEGCRFCYADVRNQNLYFGNGHAYQAQNLKNVELFLDKRVLQYPLHWKRPRLIFPCSMTDLFADFVPTEWIDEAMVVMLLADHHVYQLLTKRAERMADYFNGPQLTERWTTVLQRDYTVFQRKGCGGWTSDALKYVSHILPGVSVEDQPNYDRRMPQLQRVPLRGRWLSVEPMLGPIDFSPPESRGTTVNSDDWLQYLVWIVLGFESGKHSRPGHPSWARYVRDRCLNRTDAGRPWPLAFFYKQWGEWAPRRFDGITQKDLDSGRVVLLDPDGTHRTGKGIDTAVMERVGKKIAGDYLDGVQWHQFPMIKL
jgi:protein gp37